jgi:hypothetical protein
VEREVTQSSHITEKWYKIHNNFVKRALKKFLEACQYAYKKNPMNGAYLLDDMGQVFIESVDGFPTAEFDLHISNSSDDEQLFRDLKALVQPAIQNGNAELADIIDIYQSESTQEISRKLKQSSERMKEKAEEMQKQQMEIQQQQQQAEMQEKQQEREFEIQKHTDEMEIKRAELELKKETIYLGIEQKERDGQRKIDENSNGIPDEIDIKKLENDRLKNANEVFIKEKDLNEKIRNNKEKEKLEKLKISKMSTNNNTTSK